MLELIHGNSPRRIFGGRSLDRAMHSAFVSVTGADGTVPSSAIYDIRRRRQHPWRLLAKRLQEMRAADTPKEQAKEIVRVLDLFVDTIYDEGSAA